MHGFTKLFGTLVGSTLWQSESKETKIVWITMLAMADKNGEVQASIPGLANFSRVTIKECERALKTLSSPDPYSRTPDFKGRRIENTDGGWRILNYLKYRELGREEIRREKWARNKRTWRRRQKDEPEHHDATRGNGEAGPTLRVEQDAGDCQGEDQ